MNRIRAKARRAVIRVYAGDFGVNQAAEVGGLVGAAIAITAGVAAKGTDIGNAVATFFTSKLQ
jgi:hypothetical protein